MTDGTTTWNYTYNSDGLRTRRTNGTTTYDYIYNGGSLVQMTVTTTVNNGTPAVDTLYFTADTVTYNDTVYYYAKNIQGDVIAILNSAGTAVVTYSYNAWGNIIDLAGSMMDTLGAVNPITYRGYVYDTETRMYYLQSRYYSPTLGRFLNADDTMYLGAKGFLSYNLFAYCENNPVMGYDPIGTWDWGWEEQATLGAAVLIVGLALLLAAPTGGSSLAFGALALSSTTAVTVGSAMAITGTVMVGNAIAQATANYAKQSKKSGKERATDKPSWVNQSDVDLGKSSHQNANDMLNNKYGSGNWSKGAKSEYNRIVKWIDRGLRAVVLIITDMLMEE